MKINKNLWVIALFLVLSVSCRDTKKEIKEETQTEKAVPQNEEETSKDENSESDDIEIEGQNEENEIEETEEVLDTLSVEE
ncbi:hypothetical protein [Aquimarina rubra]|uniref:Lipoprotein n=1 Tax=Aquimarina rubra TaxID=1920033 RepID=A0ABW5LD90_9FLAO